MTTQVVTSQELSALQMLGVWHEDGLEPIVEAGNIKAATLASVIASK